MLIYIPILHFYTALFLPKVLPVTGTISLLKKLAFDQLIGSQFYITLFFFSMTLIELKSLNEGIQNWKNKYWQTLKTNWLIWPIANLINFGLVPIAYQVLFNNFVSFWWNIYLSYMQNSYKKQ